MQTACRISSLLEYYAEVQLIFCKVNKKMETALLFNAFLT